jgi:hypothetical protein
VWNNDNVVLFHGCSEESLHPANPRGIAVSGLPHNIDLTACAKRTEFGRGFYTTTWIEQAKEWANRQTKKLKARSAGRSLRKAIVLGLSVDRDKLAALDSLVFTNEDCGFWPFVTYCRSGSIPHARSLPGQPEYDVIYGPVSIWPQRLVIKDCDQVSFHTSKALAILPAVSIVATGSPYF